MRMKFLAAGFVLTSLFAPASDAVAQVMCADRDTVYSRLSQKYGESLKAVGASESGYVSFFANSESGTWTVVLVRDGDKACMIAAGDSWLDDSRTLEAFRVPAPVPPGEELL